MRLRATLLTLGLGLALTACGDDTAPAGGQAPAGGGGTTSTGGEASGGQPGTGGAGGAGGAPALHPTAGEACDVMEQNCVDPAAPKCVLDFSDKKELPSTCAEALGDAQLGESCTRPDGVTGQDTCAPGLLCNHIDVPASDPDGRCRPLCDANDQCPDGEWCFRLNRLDPNTQFEPNTRLVGHCTVSCDGVFSDTCQPGTKCLASNDIADTRRYSCFSSSDKPAGEACTSNNDCAPGLGCDQICRPFCDATHPCGSNESCGAIPLGLCYGPPPAWSCDPAAFADGAVCDCDCSQADPDCEDPNLPVIGCAGAEVCNAGHCIPPEWTCSGAYFGTNDGCDCGCGLVDPDCANATVSACQFCGDAGGCNTGACPGTIDPINNAVCQ